MTVTPGLVLLVLGGLMAMTVFGALLVNWSKFAPPRLLPTWLGTTGLLAVVLMTLGGFMLSLR